LGDLEFISIDSLLTEEALVRIVEHDEVGIAIIPMPTLFSEQPSRNHTKTKNNNHLKHDNLNNKPHTPNHENCACHFS
jgi:hypothetical protein